MRHNHRAFKDSSQEIPASLSPPYLDDLVNLEKPGLSSGAVRGITIAVPIALVLWTLLFVIGWLLLGA